MKPSLVTVFGGSGFLGRHMMRRLTEQGLRIRVAVRRPNDATFLQPLGGVGQIQLMQTNLRNPESVARAVRGADAVINLVGILHPTGKQSFDSVHAEGARSVAEACTAAGIKRLVHVSAIGADPESVSEYARSKAAGEVAVREAFPNATILRPSVVFGPEDGFFNRFAAYARILPFMPLIGGGHTRFQPVYVGDVAQAAVDAALKDGFEGETYELGGPEVLDFREIYQLILDETERRRPMIPVPFWVARADAWFLQLLPNPLLTVDQVRLLEQDNVVSDEAKTLADFGISPTPVHAILPSYLGRFRKLGQFSAPSGEAA